MEVKKFKGKDYGSLLPDARVGYLAVSGSHAYGTEVDDSDVDLRGFTVADVDAVLCRRVPECVERRGDPDVVLYEVGKFFRLAAACNPNVVELLGVPRECVLFQDEAGRLVADNARAFLSKRAFTTFGGYATSALRKVQALVEGNPEEVNHRHPKRDERSLRKHAMHLVRLLLMGTVILREGAVVTRLTEHLPLLRGIRSGEVPLEEVFRLERELNDGLKDALYASPLPEEPDREYLDGLLVRIYRQQLEGGEGRG